MELYQQAGYDLHNGRYDAVMSEFKPDPTVSPGDLTERVMHAADAEPQAYVMVYKDERDGQHKTLLLHRPKIYPRALGAVETPWDDEGWAFVGDITGQQITTVAWPDAAFRLTAPVEVPPLHEMHPDLEIEPVVQFADEESDEDVEEEKNECKDEAELEVVPGVEAESQNEKGTSEREQVNKVPRELLRTRNVMYVPPKYVPLLLGEQLTTRATWKRIGSAIIRDGNQRACRPLLNWLRISSIRTGRRGEVATCLARPEIPFADARLIAHRWGLVRQDLPWYQTGNQRFRVDQEIDDRQVIGIGGILGELIRQVQRPEPLATQPKLPSARWPAVIDAILRVCEVDDETDLPTIYHQLAKTSKKDERMIVQAACDRRAREEGAATDVPPHISAELAKKITTFSFGAVDDDNLEEGLQPFCVSYTTLERLNEAKELAALHDTIAEGTSTQLQDLLQLRAAQNVHIPHSLFQVEASLESFSIVLEVALGTRHRLVTQHRQFLVKYRSARFDLDVKAGHHKTYPVGILRWIQIRIVHWFNLARHQENVPVPNLGKLFELIRYKTWVEPALPYRYMAPPAKSNESPLVTAPRLATSSKAVAAPKVQTSGTAGSHSMVINESHNPVFTKKFKSTGFKLRDIVTEHGDPPVNTNKVPMCLSYHIRGKCYTSCKRHDTDHRKHTAKEDEDLLAWCTGKLPLAE
ncbi:MAG: hypothetical protein ACREBR_03905 [bacterium]